MEKINLTDHFLIAMPATEDPCFAKSLIYVAEHNDQGALGVIVNRPIDMNLGMLFEQIDLPLEPAVSARLASLPVFFGGPVQTNRDVGLTTSRDVLQALARDGQPREMMITLGYSGWGAGQLESELSQNAWLTVPADQHILFDVPYDEKLPLAMERLGVDFTNLAANAGHA